MEGLEYDLDDFGPATWPVRTGTLVYLFDRARKYYGMPCVMMKCWQPRSSRAGTDDKTHSHHPWRGRVQLGNGVEIEAAETEIVVLRSAGDLLDPARAEQATLPLPPGQVVYVNQKTDGEDNALIRCTVLAQRLEKIDVVNITALDEPNPDSKGASPRARGAFEQGVWSVDIRIEAGPQAGQPWQVTNQDLYVQRVEI